ncbi:MAG: hypothetical protein H6867_06485 [Rhodospirillales bacterium]|nr:hypothetical protein [Rhodospirillales bacterium]
MTAWFLAVLTGLALLPVRADAARFTGAYLLQVCDMDEQGREKVKGGHTTCQSYISGVMDYHNVLRSLNIAPKIDICIPQSMTLNDVHDVVLRYLRKHGEHDAFIAAPAVTMALYEVYPCK